MSLSSNRTPLRSILKLIEQVRLVPHVRIVLSCRPYDLDEDAVAYIVSFMTGQYDSPELGKQCDMMFHYANKWSANHKVMMANAYVKSPLCVYENRGFVKFLAGYAVVDPLKTLSWLEQIVSKKHPEDYAST